MIPDGFEYHAMLLQEPWCFPLERVRLLTPWQCRTLYIGPAAERLKAMRDGDAPPAGAEMALPPKEQFVAIMQVRFPDVPADKWAADWDRLKELEGRPDGG